MSLRSAHTASSGVQYASCAYSCAQGYCSSQSANRQKPTHSWFHCLTLSVNTHPHPYTLSLPVMLSCPVEEYGLSGLFGAFPMDAKLLHGQDNPTTWNDMQQVFPKDGFAELYRAFKASHAAGDAHVFARTYEVGSAFLRMHAHSY